MKLLFTVLLSLTIICGCNNKEVDTLTTSPKNEVVSKRSLDQQHAEKHNFTTEQQWYSLNNYSSTKIPTPKEKLQLTTRTFGWHNPSNGSAYQDYNFSLL